MRKKIILIVIAMLIVITFVIIYRLNHDISKTYTIKEDNYRYEVMIRQYNGKVIISEETYNMEPIIKVVEKDTLTLTLGKGDWYLTRFINVRDGRISEGFGNVVAYNSDKVVYPVYEHETGKIIVQDIYNKDKYYMEIIRDYAPVAVGKYMIIEAEFVDEETLLLKYYSGEEWEETSETIKL